MKKNIKTVSKKKKIPAAKKTGGKVSVKKTSTKKPIAKKTEKKGKENISSMPIAEIQAKLLTMKSEIEENIKNKKNFDLVENEVGDQIDEAAQSLEKEVLFELSDNEIKILNEIESSLRKIKNKSYGKCDQCGIEIDKKRLKAIPYSRYCIKCQVKNDNYR